MDETKTVNTEPEVTTTTEPTTQPEMTPEQYNAKMAELIAETKRLKAAVDKATADASNWKKKFTATQSEAEQLSMEKAEREAAVQLELETLRKESAINKSAKQFMGLGYTEEQAQKAAEAQFAGDNDELLRIQKAFIDEQAKTIKAELMKSMPAPTTGNDENIQMTKEQFKKMTYREQLQFKIDHPTAYDKLAR